MTRKAAFAVLIAAVLAGGCSTPDSSSQAPTVTTSVDPTPELSSSPPASPSAAPSTAPSKKPPAPAGPTYPASAKSYGSALLSAWGAKNTTRVAQLAGQSAILQLRDPQSQDKTQWTYVSCDASGDSTACLYRNGYGDDVTLTMTTAALGQPAAVTEALLDRTSYATERSAYANAFISAWQHGNVARMTRLANATVASFFKSKTPFENSTTTDMVTKVRIEPASATGGSGTYDLTFDSSKLGSAHAVTAASSAS
jgi:hypothetical protein